MAFVSVTVPQDNGVAMEVSRRGEILQVRGDGSVAMEVSRQGRSSRWQGASVRRRLSSSYPRRPSLHLAMRPDGSEGCRSPSPPRKSPDAKADSCYSFSPLHSANVVASLWDCLLCTSFIFL